MDKSALRNLIRQTDDDNVLEALWELYEYKYGVETSHPIFVDPYIPNTPSHPYYPDYYTITTCKTS